MNIFARELAQALAEHGKELSSLYSVKSDRLAIPPSKVTRLKRSLTHDHTATLNAEELDLLREKVPLSSEDMRRVRAALVAETVRYMLAGRMLITIANQIAAQLFELLVVADTEHMSEARDRVLEQLRGDAFEMVKHQIEASSEARELAADADEGPIERALEAATSEYEAGTLWLEIARDTRERSARLGFLAQAESLLMHARKLATHPASVALNSPQQAELLHLIEESLAEIDLLR